MSTPEESWTVGRLLNWTVEYLGKYGSENPRLDAEVLLAHARGCRRIDLYTAFGEPATEETRSSFRELVKRRATGTPVAYLVGHREFYSLDFEVTPDVLIPRPETELLIVALLDALKQQPAPESITIADVGTGSGVLAVCAAKYVPAGHITAIDISPAALAVAERNAARHGVSDRISFVESNLFAGVSPELRYDYILSNPPYVAQGELDQLEPTVRDHEPHLALVAGPQGTEVIAPLLEQSVDRLKIGGRLFIEISPMIEAKVEHLTTAQPALQMGLKRKDLAGHVRVIEAVRRDSIAS